MERQYVAIDLHRRRSVIVRENPAGEELGVVRIDNDPTALAAAIAEAGESPEVAIEATYGWYWAVDALEAQGAQVRLVNPSGLEWENRRVKNDYRDCKDLITRMRINKLPQAWIAPPLTRELRELVRYRAKLVAIRTSFKAQIKAVLAKLGINPPVDELYGPTGTAFLDELDLDNAFGWRIESLRELIAAVDEQIDWLDVEISSWLNDDKGYWAIRQIPGIGPVMASIFVAEIGDVTRFSSPEVLCSWAGLTPKHRESDTKVHRGKITKQGSKLVRWAAIEAVAQIRGNPKLKADYERIAERRGTKVARVAAARKLLTLVYYGLRDGEIRCLAQLADAG
ncbi:MAG TPA: IS110 family transposase [Acidimicrobiales bacterium]|nr:IS110 family transposase [Acidimicrobiales bacterium]